VSWWPWDAPLLHVLMLLAALAWDRRLGEPPHWLHPVVWMGHLIGGLRDLAPRGRPFLWGLLMALLLPLLCAAAGVLAVTLPWVGWFLGVWLLKSSFAIRSLGEAGARVGEPLSSGRVEDARAGLSWLCSRDASELTAAELAGAAAESVAENASDSGVAPLFWFALLGVPGALAYRCVNTLDAMIGYRDRYFWLGKASARLDDVLNLVPARLTALLFLASTLDPSARRRGWRIGWRDHGATDSPNAGWPMATMAGILGVRLTKRGQYSLGEARKELEGDDVARAWRIAERAMYASALVPVLLWSVWSLAR
jgi:adenosylcobinamide-phosphate synthase